MQTKRCTKCGTEKPHDQFSKDKSTKDGLHPHCKHCLACYYKANRQRIVEYRKANQKRATAYLAAWRKANPERAAELLSEYRKANPDKINAQVAKRRAAKLRATPPWLTKDDFAAIQQFYTMSNQLTELNGKIYHVDHIIPLLGKTVCGLHVPWNLQILDGPENLAKSNKLVLPAEQAWN